MTANRTKLQSPTTPIADIAVINATIDNLKKHPRIIACAVLILLYGLLGFFLAPYLLEKNLVRLVQQDYDAALRVERIAINPFVLSLQIDGLELDNPQGEPGARIGEIFINLQLSSIFRRALTFDEVRLVSPHLFVARDAAGSFDFEYLLTATGNDEPAPASSDESAPFPLLVFHLTLENATVDWHDHTLAEPVKTQLGPIAIGIEELSTLPDRSGRQAVTITTEHGGRLNWSGDLQLHPLKSTGRAVIDGAFFPLLSAYLRHQSGIDFVNGLAHIEFNYDLSETDGNIRAQVDQVNIRVTDIAIHSFADGTGFDFAGPDAPILALQELRLSGGEMRWPERVASLQSLTLDRPTISLSRAPDGVFNLQPANATASASAEAAIETPPNTDAGSADDSEWQLSLGQFEIKNLVLELLDRALDPEVKHRVEQFNLTMNDISNKPGQRFATKLDLRVGSGGALSLEGDIALLPEPALDLAIALDALQLAASQPYVQQQLNLNFNSGALHLDGRVSVTDNEPLAFAGDLNITDLELAESIDNASVAAWDSFRAERIDLSLGERRVDIASLRFDRLYGDIEIDRERRLNVTRVTRADTASDTNAPRSASDAANGDPAFAVQIGDIELVDASVDFSDLSLPLPFEAKIDALNGKVSTVATSSNEPAEVAFEGRVNEFGEVRIEGSITPLDPPLNTDLRVDFSNIEMAPMSPYSITFAGRKIASGKLDLGLGYQVKDSQLAGANRIVLRDFELGETVSHEGALDLPFDLVIALLTDVDGKIGIDLPISGNVDSPDFQYGDVVLTALSDLLVKIVLSPFAALGNMLGIDASELEHIDFQAGRARLSPPQREKALKLAAALAQRPQLQLVIAGAADPQADGLALRAAGLDQRLAQRVQERVASGDPKLSKMQHRQAVLEQMFAEQASGESATRLETLRQQFTEPKVIEGQAEPVPTLDKLAYGNELRRQLIDLQTLDDDALAALANRRAQALVDEMLAIDATLAERVSIADPAIAAQQPTQPVRMPVSLESVE